MVAKLAALLLISHAYIQATAPALVVEPTHSRTTIAFLDSRQLGGLLGPDEPANEPLTSSVSSTETSHAHSEPSKSATSTENIINGLLPGLDLPTSTTLLISSMSSSRPETKTLEPTTFTSPTISLLTNSSTLSMPATSISPPAPTKTVSTSNTVFISSKSWKRIGIAVICVAAVAAIVCSVLFFDTWWSLVHDMAHALSPWKKNNFSEPDLVPDPDWKTHEWEHKLMEGTEEFSRYPSKERLAEEYKLTQTIDPTTGRLSYGIGYGYGSEYEQRHIIYEEGYQPPTRPGMIYRQEGARY